MLLPKHGEGVLSGSQMDVGHFLCPQDHKVDVQQGYKWTQEIPSLLSGLHPSPSTSSMGLWNSDICFFQELLISCHLGSEIQRREISGLSPPVVLQLSA